MVCVKLNVSFTVGNIPGNRHKATDFVMNLLFNQDKTTALVACLSWILFGSLIGF